MLCRNEVNQAEKLTATTSSLFLLKFFSFLLPFTSVFGGSTGAGADAGSGGVKVAGDIRVGVPRGVSLAPVAEVLT